MVGSGSLLRASVSSFFAGHHSSAVSAVSTARPRRVARWSSVAAVAALAAAALLLGATASATTYTVTRFDDTLANGPNTGDGLGTGASGDLRYEILAANLAGGANTINFSCPSAPCTITLNGPLPPIFATASTPGGIAGYNLTIDGGYYGQVILDGASSYRVFFVDNVAVTLDHLQIQNAKATGGAGGSGGNAEAGGGGGGAGFGAGLFVNQLAASVIVENTAFIDCTVAGGNGAQEAPEVVTSAVGAAAWIFPGRPVAAGA